MSNVLLPVILVTDRNAAVTRGQQRPDQGGKGVAVGTKYQGTEQEVLALNTFIRLQRAVGAVEGYLGRTDPFPDRLTVSQFGVLEALLHLGPLCQNELGAKILKSKANITVVVDHLERAGLVLRAPHPTDRRMVRVELTPEGRKLITEIFPARLRSIVEAFSVLSSTEQVQLGTLCRKLGIGLQERGD